MAEQWYHLHKFSVISVWLTCIPPIPNICDHHIMNAYTTLMDAQRFDLRHRQVRAPNNATVNGNVVLSS